MIDWQALKLKAEQGANNAYAPYSNFHVGAAALTENGVIVHGCNVENASFGLTVCAERNCLSNAVVNGERKISALVVYTKQEKLTPPCGACRQVIAEFMSQDSIVKAMNHLGDEQQWSVAELLPDAFLPKDLEGKS